MVSHAQEFGIETYRPNRPYSSANKFPSLDSFNFEEWSVVFEFVSVSSFPSLFGQLFSCSLVPWTVVKLVYPLKLEQ